ncbi:hypothetical protein [Paracoccus sp. PARArs4]|uniref:hypothetical protein n=1 Tax=Paracoccus sp. PARArs4 TaxID=2853442 RepID=UPI0024A71310|nr:hypothetical protein [Paracoccus sp. PARArs4]
MTKHIADQPRLRGQSRMQHFLRQDRDAMPHESSLSLQSRPQGRDGQLRKSAEFARIERGRLA